MAEALPYGSLPHDGFWPLLGQKSCYKKCDRTGQVMNKSWVFWGVMVQSTIAMIPLPAGLLFLVI